MRRRSVEWSPFDVTGVEGGAITGSVAGVFSSAGGKVVITREILLGAHVEVVMMTVMQHGIHRGGLGNADRTRRKPFVFVGVIR